jgi:hypothetical protein
MLVVSHYIRDPKPQTPNIAISGFVQGSHTAVDELLTIGVRNSSATTFGEVPDTAVATSADTDYGAGTSLFLVARLGQVGFVQAICIES